MKKQRAVLGQSVFLVAVLATFACLRAGAQTANAQPATSTASAQQNSVPARITQAIDESKRVVLRGNVHPLARPEFDQGAVEASLPMNRMLLLLRRSQDQESALLQLVSEQQNKNSANFHTWITPEQFGQQFGPADGDIQKVTGWLTKQGFQVAKVSKGKIAIEFSGTAAQVRQAFHTEVHRYSVNGTLHLANASDPQIPAALFPVVRGLAPLNDFRSKPMHRVAGQFTKSVVTGEVKKVNPELTTSSGFYGIGPADFATIYNVTPQWTAGIDGTGESIAVVGISNINLQDVTDYRTLFGLPTGGAANTPIVVIDGTDPGIATDGSETEALLDVQRSGSVAKNAQIHLVIAASTDVADGLFLAIFNVIDNNSDPVLNVSFGSCEASLGAANTGLLDPLWEQAAAQGITVTVSSGDDGAAGCDDQNAPAPAPATHGLQVSGFASTPFNVAVGGTDFNDAGTQTTYFNATNDATYGSAKSYIPESTWNDTCTNVIGLTATPEANCNAASGAAGVLTVGASGGKSSCVTTDSTTGACNGGYAKPAYQNFISAANGMPADTVRDIPDVSLFSGTGVFNNTSFVVCEADLIQAGSPPSCVPDAQGHFSFLGVGGTSASAPSFAGIIALVDQKTGQRQGNANFVLYKLAQNQYTAATACDSLASPAPNGACMFYDITVGSDRTPCTGAADCTKSTGTDAYGVLNGYDTNAGYDLATGIGSVNVNNLVNNWATGEAAFTATNTTLNLSPTTGLTAGQNVTVNVTVTGSGGTPTGDVALVSTASTGEGVTGFTLTAGKVVNGTTDQLTGGTYTVTARYAGDATFAPSVSAPVTVTVGKASSTTVASVLALSGGTFVNFTSGAAPITLYLTANLNPIGDLLPTGTVTFLDNGVPVPGASNVGVDSAFEAFVAISTFGTGNHSIVAQYSGDASFTGSSSTAVPFTLTLATTTTVTTSAATIASGGSVTLTAKVSTTSNGAGPTGTVQFKNGSTALGSAVTCTPTAGTVSATAFCTATLTTTLAMLTPPTAPRNIPSIPWGPIWIVGLLVLMLLLLIASALPAAKRRYAYAGLVLFACLTAGIAGCGGGSSGGGGSHTDSITAVYSGDANYSGSTSAAVSITVQ